jgi:hypothetical protein
VKAIEDLSGLLGKRIKESLKVPRNRGALSCQCFKKFIPIEFTANLIALGQQNFLDKPAVQAVSWIALCCKKNHGITTFT